MTAKVDRAQLVVGLLVWTIVPAIAYFYVGGKVIGVDLVIELLRRTIAVHVVAIVIVYAAFYVFDRPEP